jgi:hypothetical protein
MSGASQAKDGFDFKCLGPSATVSLDQILNRERRHNSVATGRAANAVDSGRRSHDVGGLGRSSLRVWRCDGKKIYLIWMTLDRRCQT